MNDRDGYDYMSVVYTNLVVGLGAMLAGVVFEGVSGLIVGAVLYFILIVISLIILSVES